MTESLHQKPSEVNQNLRHSIDSQNIIETAESTVEERKNFSEWYYRTIGESNPNCTNATQAKPIPNKTSSPANVTYLAKNQEDTSFKSCSGK